VVVVAAIVVVVVIVQNADIANVHVGDIRSRLSVRHIALGLANMLGLSHPSRIASLRFDSRIRIFWRFAFADSSLRLASLAPAVT